MNQTFSTFIYAISIIQGIVFGTLISNGHKKSERLLYLGLMILTFSLDFVPTLLDDVGVTSKYPFLLLLPLDFTWITTTLLYIYIQKIPDLLHKKVSYWSLYLGLFCIFCNIIIFFLPIEMKQKIKASLLYDLYTSVGLVYSVIIVVFSFRLLNKKRMKLQDSFYTSDFYEVRMAYYFISVMLLLLIVFILLLAVVLLYSNLYGILNVDFLGTFSLVSDLILLYWYIIFGIKHKYFLSIYRDLVNNKKKVINRINTDTEKEEYENIISRLDEFLIETEAFKKNNFSILDASNAINIHTKKISTALNSLNTQNFNSYINQYRIEAAKQLLKEQTVKDYSLEGIGNLVGFNSKSTFFKEFKKCTGTTPLQYYQKASD